MKPPGKQPSPSQTDTKNDRLAAAQALMVANITRPLVTDENDHHEPKSIRDEQFDNAANQLFKPSWSLTSIDRMEIYNRQYWYRVLDSMLDDFPGLQTILGAEKFDNLVTAYVEANPSTTYTLRDLGCKLPMFIVEHPDLCAPDQEVAHQMALFEWAAIEAFDNKRYPILPPNAMSAASPDALVLKLQPYITIMESDYALDDFALKVEKVSSQHCISTALASRSHCETKEMRPNKKHCYIVIYRLQNSVYYKRIDKEQFCLLTSIKSGASLGQACEELAGQLTSSKLATLPDRLRQYFSKWMELNWFADPTAMN